ncbi:flagellar protein [Alkalicoccus urumqiensis]|uniref:Flagellar protein FliT n=1 Tax=Alkalicoccus urumqiensis TaxID=1548213 RepID=A0A2P6MHB1_ALKUR|nr:flagellar protein [Alkalicoccus urumqiensis]PRO65630.1 flagellar protein [Alkalicoccus urumqiensis]
MAGFKGLYQTTKALHAHVQMPYPKEDDERDAYIERVTALLSERQEHLDAAGRPQSEAEEKIAREIIRLNQEIQPRLEGVQKEIQQNIQGLGRKRKTSQRYENPYTGPTVDGIFFDSKK